MGSIEVRDEAQGCLILFTVQSLHSDVVKDAPSVVHWGEMSDADITAFRIAAHSHARKFAEEEKLI